MQVLIPRYLTLSENCIRNNEWAISEKGNLYVKDYGEDQMIVLSYKWHAKSYDLQAICDIHNANLLLGISDDEYNASLDTNEAG